MVFLCYIEVGHEGTSLDCEASQEQNNFSIRSGELPSPVRGLLAHSGIFSAFHPIRKGNFLPCGDKEGKGIQTALWSLCIYMQPSLSVNKFI